ncbi:hypothetical protein RND81_05G045500 [Saponaria officinalis]|uniref:Zinc knuckle CX2CX4HX4C domain-containing protein n=1 Tax=Saponaria officinalis TaxID=3572 RepID=A0AAW1KQW0_SAPOF
MPLKFDAATSLKLRLGFVRVMVGVSVGDKCIEQIVFADEKEQIHEVKVSYDWKPVLCKKCRGFGHEEGNCKNGRVQPPQVWRPVQRPPPMLVPVAASAHVPENVVGQDGLVTPGLGMHTGNQAARAAKFCKGFKNREVVIP